MGKRSAVIIFFLGFFETMPILFQLEKIPQVHLQKLCTQLVLELYVPVIAIFR